MSVYLFVSYSHYSHLSKAKQRQDSDCEYFVSKWSLPLLLSLDLLVVSHRAWSLLKQVYICGACITVCLHHWPAQVETDRLLAADFPSVVTIDEVTSLANDAEFYRRIKTMRNLDQWEELAAKIWPITSWLGLDGDIWTLDTSVYSRS